MDRSKIFRAIQARRMANRVMLDDQGKQPNSYPRHLLLFKIAFWFSLLVLVLCLAQEILGYPFRKKISLASSKFESVGGFAYSYPLPRKYSPRGTQTASARLWENDTILSSYSPRETSVSAVGQGIFAISDEKRLIISATDNSDPRINGRKYSLDAPLRVSKQVLPISFTLLLLTAGLVFWKTPNRKEAVTAWGHRIRALRPIITFLGRWPAIILSFPSIYLLSSYPPLWKDIDANSQLLGPASDLNILHFPPVYSFLGRIPFALTTWWSEGGRSPFPSLFDQQMPPLAGFYFLVVIQHLLLIAALTYVVTVLTQDRTLRCLFAFLLASVSAFYTHAQCCGSEALSVSATLGLLAAGFAIVRGRKLTPWVIYGVALFLAIGSRQINLLFALWLPLTLAFLSLATKFKWCYPQTEPTYWKAAIIALIVAIGTVGLNRGITQILITSVHDEYRSTLGRTISDRIATFLDKLPVKERLKLAQDLANKTANPEIKIAILAQATDGSFYQGSSLTVAEQLARLAPNMNIAAERDRVVLAASMRYLMTLHPLLIKVIWQDFLKGIFVDNAKIALSPFYANAYPALDRIRRPEVWANLKGLEALSSVNNFEATRVLDRSKLDPYVLFWHKIPLGVIIILSFLLGGPTCIPDKKIPATVVVGLFAMGAGVVLFAANCVSVYYMPRYSLPLLTTSVFALLTSIAPFADGWAASNWHVKPALAPADISATGKFTPFLETLRDQDDHAKYCPNNHAK
jgi:hypothetical protein